MKPCIHRSRLVRWLGRDREVGKLRGGREVVSLVTLCRVLVTQRTEWNNVPTSSIRYIILAEHNVMNETTSLSTAGAAAG